MDGLITVREQCPGNRENMTGRFQNADIHVREVAGGCSVSTETSSFNLMLPSRTTIKVSCRQYVN